MCAEEEVLHRKELLFFISSFQIRDSAKHPQVLRTFYMASVVAVEVEKERLFFSIGSCVSFPYAKAEIASDVHKMVYPNGLQLVGERKMLFSQSCQ